MGFSTRQLHAGGASEPATPRALPIYLTAGFEFQEFDDGPAHFGEGVGFGYTRTGNPTLRAVEAKLADLEGGAGAILTSSGQAAMTVALLALAGAGDHVVCSTHIYEGTRGLLRDNLSRLGITVDYVTDVRDPDAWRAAIRPETRVLIAESISNATNYVLDTERVAQVANDHGIALVVDNTLASPYLARPLEYGADFVVHSTSKFLSGHGSVLGGVVIDAGNFDAERSGRLYPHLVAKSRLGGASFYERFGGLARTGYARDVTAQRFGPTPSPLGAFLTAQGIETLSIRVERQSQNALGVAEWLETQPAVQRVEHVGLTSHPDHDLGLRYLSGGFGSVFQFTLVGGIDAARRFVEALQTITHMTHLGDVRSLILHPATTSHVGLSPAEQLAVGVHPGTLRLSIGLEDLPDLIDDLRRGLEAAG